MSLRRSLVKIGSLGRSMSRKGKTLPCLSFDRDYYRNKGKAEEREEGDGGSEELWSEEGDEEVGEEAGEGVRPWSRMLPELLSEIIQRVEASEQSWPVRKNVVACASVCRRWREITRGVVKAPQDSGIITFPLSLKELERMERRRSTIKYLKLFTWWLVHPSGNNSMMRASHSETAIA